MERVFVYVDGFNFYYGLRTQKRLDDRWQKSYWIDLVKLFEQFLGDNQVLEKVIYFTASPLNREKSARQSAFLNANKLHCGKCKLELIIRKNGDGIPPIAIFLIKSYELRICSN